MNKKLNFNNILLFMCKIWYTVNSIGKKEVFVVKCRYCGAQLSEESRFCHKCGKTVQVKKQASEYEYEDDEPKKGSRVLLTLLITLILLVLLLLSAVISNWFFTKTGMQSPEQENVNQTPSVVATVVPETETEDDMATPKPKATKKPTASDDEYVHIEQPTYKTYTDSEFRFSCAYPSHFEKYIDNTSSARYTLRANNGEMTMKICAEENSAGITLQQSLSMFKSKHSGEVEYSNIGETYYAVRINEDGFCYYKYLRSKNKTFYWFEFTYPKDEQDTYEGYIQHIYESFTVK